MSCKDCFCYSTDTIPQDPEHPRGLCRRYAPRPRMRESKFSDDTADWPLVRPDDWCGEYAAAKLPKPPPQVITKRP